MERTSKITYRKLTEAELPTFLMRMLRTVTPSLINLTPSKMHLT